MKRRLTLIIGIAFSILLVGGVAYASIPGPGGVINGCRKNTDGSMRVIDSAATCPSGWTALNWNQTGPQGSTGPTGPTGPAGPTLSGVPYNRVFVTQDPNPENAPHFSASGNQYILTVTRFSPYEGEQLIVPVTYFCQDSTGTGVMYPVVGIQQASYQFQVYFLVPTNNLADYGIAVTIFAYQQTS